MKVLISEVLAAAKKRRKGYLAEIQTKSKQEGLFLIISDADWLSLRIKYQGRSKTHQNLPPLYRELNRTP